MFDQLIHGDCLHIPPTLASESVNFVLTDTPYLARYGDRSGRSLCNDDNDRWLKPAFAELYRVLARNSYAVSFYGWPQTDRFMQAWREAGFRIAGHLVFPKSYASSTAHVAYQHECAYLLAKGYRLPGICWSTSPPEPWRTIAATSRTRGASGSQATSTTFYVSLIFRS